MVQSLVVFAQLQYPAFSLNKLKELVQQRRRLQRAATSEYNELGFRTGERDVDPSPVLDEVSGLPLLIRPHQRNQNHLLISPLAAIRRHDLDLRPPIQHCAKQLDLLPIQSNDPDLVLRHPTLNERLGELSHELRFDGVLDEVADHGIASRKTVCVDKDDFASLVKYLLDPARSFMRAAWGMQLPKEGFSVGKLQSLRPRPLVTALQSITIYELVGQTHDIFVHPVLLGQIHDCMRMRIRKHAEQRKFETPCTCLSVANQRRELEMITNKDELVCEPEWPQTGGQCDLRSFIDDAVLECSSGE